MQFINCMSEGSNRFRQHDTVRKRIPQINNTLSKLDGLVSILGLQYSRKNADVRYILPETGTLIILPYLNFVFSP